MIITPCPHGLEDVLGKSVGHRTPGVHISAIYGDLYQRLEPDRFKRGVPDPDRLEGGLCFENVIERELGERLTIFRPGEIVSPEGIILSPDGIILNGTVRLAEFKLTWLSSNEMPKEPSNNLPHKFSKYGVQMMAYMYVLGLTEGRLYIYFVNDTYPRGAPAPKLRAYNLQYTPREIADNWGVLTRHGHEIGLLRGGRVISPEEYAQHGK